MVSWFWARERVCRRAGGQVVMDVVGRRGGWGVGEGGE